MSNPSEASVRKNINIKFNTNKKEDQYPVTKQDIRQGRSRSRSRSSRSRSSRSSSRSSRSTSSSRSRSRSRSYDRYSSSQSESPQKSHRVGVNGISSLAQLQNGAQLSDKIVDWTGYQLNFCGEASKDPTIFMCDLCRLPVINYGRLLPCKHTFCYPCALSMNESDSKQACTKCRNAIQSVELCPPGQLYICAHGGSKLHGGCRRAYRSAEDLQTHANQRHNGSTGGAQNSETNQLEAASAILASIPVHHSISQAIPNLPPGLAGLAGFQGAPNLFQARPNFPFANPMMAQAALLIQAQQQAAAAAAAQAQAQAAPFLFARAGGPGSLFMAPPPLVFAATPNSSGNSAQHGGSQQQL